MFNDEYFYNQAIKFNKLNLQDRDYDYIEKEISIENKKIPFNTFRNNWLSDEHISQIENEMIQAIGRFRPIQNKINIYVFSKLPILCNQ